MNIDGKLCIVTGAAKSIGYSISQKLSKLGAKVIMLDIDSLVEESANQLNVDGNVFGYTIDISIESEVTSLFERIITEFGPVYSLINVAGVVTQKPIEDVNLSDWKKMMDVNVYGSFNCIKAVVPSMKQMHDGKIINFSSKSGKTGSALMVPYSAAKGAIISMTQAVSHELASYNIKVNALCPGIVEETGVWDSVSKGYIENLKMKKNDVIEKFTKKIPLQRLAKIDDIVEFTEFLVTSGEYCTGQAFNITGGREMH